MQHQEADPRWPVLHKVVKHTTRRLVSRKHDLEMVIYDDHTSAFRRALFATMAIERPGAADDGWQSCFVPSHPWTTIDILASEPSTQAVKRPSISRMSPIPSRVVLPGGTKARTHAWRHFRWRPRWG